ncbi:MAG: DUF1993 domain-containing protein [Halioglobus sp.]
MAISLYDISVANYLQILGGVKGVLEKGVEFAAAHNVALEDIVATRLRDDMQPFKFQVISVYHHSWGAIEGIREGVFTPPPAMPQLDYAGLQGLVDTAISELQAVASAEIDAMEDRVLKFKAGKFEIPFTAANFILSFSLPNFYFHATTTYDILRMQGVPLGKMDFLGRLRVSS